MFCVMVWVVLVYLVRLGCSWFCVLKLWCFIDEMMIGMLLCVRMCLVCVCILVW